MLHKYFVCLIFIGKGCRRKIFSGENFAIYGIYIHSDDSLLLTHRGGFSSSIDATDVRVDVSQPRPVQSVHGHEDSSVQIAKHSDQRHQQVLHTYYTCIYKVRGERQVHNSSRFSQ